MKLQSDPASNGGVMVIKNYQWLHLRETGWSPIYCRRRFLRRSAPSTRGPEWTDLWCIGCRASGTVE